MPRDDEPLNPAELPSPASEAPVTRSRSSAHSPHLARARRGRGPMVDAPLVVELPQLLRRDAT